MKLTVILSQAPTSVFVLLIPEDLTAHIHSTQVSIFNVRQ